MQLATVGLLLVVSGGAVAQNDQCTPQLCWQVEPTVCISDQTNGQCDLTFNLRWNSQQPLSVCAELSDEPLYCWVGQTSGQLTHQTLIAGPQQLQLSVDGETKLAKQLSVLSRQPARRKRLVAPWSVF